MHLNFLKFILRLVMSGCKRRWMKRDREIERRVKMMGGGRESKRSNNNNPYSSVITEFLFSLSALLVHILFASVAFMSIICLYIWLWCMYEIKVPLLLSFLLFSHLLDQFSSFHLLLFLSTTLASFIPSFANITISEIIIIISIVSSLLSPLSM